MTSWPTDTDLVTLFTTLGVWNATLTPLVSGCVDSARLKFEQLTGRQPFLAETVASSCYFDPPGSVSKSYLSNWRGGNRILELDNSYISIDAVLVGHSADTAGTPLDLNRDLRFLPLNYSNKGIPIDEIEFLTPIWGRFGSVVVVGKRGYSTTVPNDVWTAILQEAASIFLPNLALYLTGGSVSQSEADVDLKFPSDGSTLGAQSKQWHSYFMSVMYRYRLLRLGV